MNVDNLSKKIENHKRLEAEHRRKGDMLFKKREKILNNEQWIKSLIIAVEFSIKYKDLTGIDLMSKSVEDVKRVMSTLNIGHRRDE